MGSSPCWPATEARNFAPPSARWLIYNTPLLHIAHSTCSASRQSTHPISYSHSLLQLPLAVPVSASGSAITRVGQTPSTQPPRPATARALSTRFRGLLCISQPRLCPLHHFRRDEAKLCGPPEEKNTSHFSIPTSAIRSPLDQHRRCTCSRQHRQEEGM